MGLVVAATLSLLVSLLTAAPASAAPGSPTGLTPSGSSVQGMPVLSWSRVSAATSYNVQVSTDPTFATTRYKVTTTNDTATPTTQLPAGELWWRVQAVSSSGASDWSTTSFERSALAGPALVSPEDGDLLEQPSSPALLSWTPLSGAASYTVEIDDAADFIGATKYTTKTSSYVVPNPQIAAGIYYWRVRANLASDVFTDYSETRTYSIGPLPAPALTSPADSALTSIEDIVLDWEPVVGAASYDLQISTDENFLTIDHGASVKSTRYSPATTLDNDQYFWRVRPVDTLGNKVDWAAVETWAFRRHWPDQPQLEYPVGNAIVGDPFYFQWTPVDKASRYQVEISTTEDFASKDTCSTVHTTYVPRVNGDCWPAAAGTYYWRVLAFDDPYRPGGVVTDGIAAQVGRFSYDPSLVPLLSPAPDSTVSVPTLSWAPVSGAATYKVYLYDVTDSRTIVNGADTAATSYTPRAALAVGNTFRWWVRPVSASGRQGATLVPDAQPRFTVTDPPVGTAASPEQEAPTNNQTSERPPPMQWSATAGASYYRIAVRPAESIQAFTELSDTFPYPAGDDDRTSGIGTLLSRGSYEWIVNAYDSSNVKIASSTSARVLTIVSLDPVSGPKVAITGAATSQTDRFCSAQLPARCEDLRQTPVLRWDANANAGSYRVYISRDREMTNMLDGYDPITVDSNLFMPSEAFIDSQAGDAFYWYVAPCTAAGACGPLDYAPWAFNKKSNPAQLKAPADGATVQNDVTFTWEDYLVTNSADVTGRTDLTGVNPRIEARTYLVEVSTVPNFQTVLNSAEVDQTTYTAPTLTYPEGTLYWRVSPIDGSGNRLTPSTVRTFTKSSPVPTLTSPTNGEEIDQTQPFRWEALAYAASYDIEVYRNNDTLGQSGNKVFSGNSKQIAFTTTSPLPVSDQLYTWRIRRVDASGRAGDWTDLAAPEAKFRVVAPQPVQLQPDVGVTMPGADTFFAWEAVDGASSYRFERRLSGADSTAEVVSTASLAWAPTKTIGDGSYEWRVSTIDAGGKVLATSPWRGFRVDGTRPFVTSTSPTGSAGPKANFVVRFSEKVTNVNTSTFRIFQKGVPDPRPAKVTLSSSGLKAVLNPNRNLKRGKVYIVKVSSQVKDLSGLALQATKWKVRIK